MAQIVALAPPLQTLRVLLIEDSASDALLIQKSLMKAVSGGCHVRREVTLESALKALGEEEFDVALLDLSLPDSTEFDGLLSIQNLAPKLPVVILTAYADEDIALKAVSRGTQDYLFKDKVDGKSIQRAMQYAIQRKQFEATLINQANFDMLTGLANRTLFESRLDMALARMRRSGAGLGLFFFDLNRFKQVNDTFGHAAGDYLLQQVAERLKQCIRPYDTASRFGGDEFALLVEGIAQARDCAAIAQKILGRIAEPFKLGRKKAEVGVSIGIATCLAGEKIDRETLMQNADKAMYGAKLSPHSNYRFYTQEIHEEACARLGLEDELRSALLHGNLTLHYQPKLNLNTGKTTGAEALVRWSHAKRGLLLPGEFMAIAEETGMAKEIGEWVLIAVCDDLSRWKKAELPPMQVSVNLFPGQLDDAALVETLRTLLAKYNLPASLLALEVPSGALLERMRERVALLQKIHDLGIGVHLDHFGTAAVSLASLAALPVDAVKIAPGITNTINDPGGMLPLVQAILDIAGRFNVGVIAGGIENEWQQAFFRERHCREGQGYGLCRPVPGEYIPDWLSRNKISD